MLRKKEKLEEEERESWWHEKEIKRKKRSREEEENKRKNKKKLQKKKKKTNLFFLLGGTLSWPRIITCHNQQEKEEKKKKPDEMSLSLSLTTKNLILFFFFVFLLYVQFFFLFFCFLPHTVWGFGGQEVLYGERQCGMSACGIVTLQNRPPKKWGLFLFSLEKMVCVLFFLGTDSALVWVTQSQFNTHKNECLLVTFSGGVSHDSFSTHFRIWFFVRLV